MNITMSFWKENVDRILSVNDKTVLKGKGKVSNAQMEKKVKDVYARFDARRKADDAIQADRLDVEEIEKKLKNRENN